MKILVTGGTGYIGSHTCVELPAAGHEVVIADNLSNSSIRVLERIEQIAARQPLFRKLDMRDLAALQALLTQLPVQAVIHFAGVKAVAESVADPYQMAGAPLRGAPLALSPLGRVDVPSLVRSAGVIPTAFAVQA